MANCGSEPRMLGCTLSVLCSPWASDQSVKKPFGSGNLFVSISQPLQSLTAL